MPAKVGAFAAAAIGFLVVVVIAFAVWLWWPDANTLTGAAGRGDIDGVRWGLRLGVNPNTPSRWGWRHENDGQTPLTAAAQFGRVDVVRMLLQNGADPNLRDFGPDFPHQTPLATAAMHGQLEVCRILLEAGADPNVPSSPNQPGDTGNWTALDWALQANHPAVADLLRQRGGRESRERANRLP
jgi:ankyrin repeat protein